MIKYNLPLFIQMNVDEDGNRVSTEVLNEQIKIVNNTTFLSGVPDEYYRVNVGGVFVEIDISEEITTANQFKCNYQTGQLWFHSSRSGSTITVVRYYSYGVIFYPSDRIYTETSGGSVTQTLQDVINTSKMVWKNPVASYSLITPTYPSPTDGWTVQVLADSKIYRYDGTAWQWIQTVNTSNSFIKTADDSDDITQGTTNLFLTNVALGSLVNNSTNKSTPADTDMIPIMDSEAVNIVKKLSFANIKSTIATYYNTLAATLTNKTLTAPKITSASYIADTNGNELIKFPATVASAVNEITISNSVTGAAPTVATTGTDPNINLNLISKGTGTVQANGYDVLTANTNTTITPTITTGTNSVIRKTDNIESFPKFTMQGKSYTNLLGKDGNCEDVSKFTASQCTPTLDATNKVFGANGIKLTLTATTGYFYKTVSASGMDVTKYYFISAYLKNGNSAGGIYISKDNTGGGTPVGSATITSTSEFTRVGIVVQPSQLNSSNLISVTYGGVVGQYAYVDGIQINEITSAEYALGATALLAKYPYIDSYACLQNPYIEVRHDNLVRNGNGEEGLEWWMFYSPSTGTLSIENGKFKFVSTSDNNIANTVNVKPNTNYYFSANKSGTGSSVQVVNIAGTQLLSSGGTFNTGAYTQVNVRMTNTGAVTCYYDSFMLIEGTTAPTSYKPCRIERCVIEGKFTSDDSFTLENGEVTGLLNWKHRTLFGKDYDWQYVADGPTFKYAGLTINDMPNASTNCCIKYDGKILKLDGVLLSSDSYRTNGATALQVTLSDTDTGWVEAIAPNADEVKAFMNGWKAVYNNGTRYLNFLSVVDGSVPSVALKTLVTSATTGTTINVTAGTGTQYAASDVISIIRGGVYISSVTVSSVTANTIVVNVSSTVAIGDIIVKADTASSIPLLTYCKNNISPNYEGYQLHYKLANPEPITDVNTHIHGDIPKLDNGDNYLYLDYGMVLGEVANPQYDGATYYFINNVYSVSNARSALRNKAEVINSLYRNAQYNNGAWTFRNGAGVTSYGSQDVYTVAANFDTNATYTVDYQILKTLHTSPTTITTSYQQDVLNAISDLAEAVESKQNRDSALDTVIDLSVYEKFLLYHAIGRAVQYTAVDFRIYNTIPFNQKKATPTISYSGVIAYYYDGSTGVLSIPVSDVYITFSGITKNYVVLVASYIGTNTTIRTAVMNYGMNIILQNLTFDCSGRI